MCGLGKIYQRLGDHEVTLRWFATAFAMTPDHPDVAREAGIAAMELGRAAEALEFCLAAVANRPDDAGLVCNLALAYCLAGNDSDALRCAIQAAERDPADVVTLSVRDFVTQVASGRRKRPKSYLDVNLND
jgi:Flp pilus assembly protein TadD